jgi:hypothetical protein
VVPVPWKQLFSGARSSGWLLDDGWFLDGRGPSVRDLNLSVALRPPLRRMAPRSTERLSVLGM